MFDEVKRLERMLDEKDLEINELKIKLDKAIECLEFYSNSSKYQDERPDGSGVYKEGEGVFYQDNETGFLVYETAIF